ncbi:MULTISPECIES: hypothetical protein [unclassified Streptomyces]|nr:MULTISPECIES: hypothetical protein [unclassified Streptomyces]
MRYADSARALLEQAAETAPSDSTTRSTSPLPSGHRTRRLPSNHA